MDISYLPDARVDEQLDADLRTLLSGCFGDAFKNKRYHFEPPTHRWLVRDEGQLVAHLAVHDKTFEYAGTITRFLGIAEVCVAPSHRGRGLVKRLLGEMEARFSTAPFAILLGEAGVYGSSGYDTVHNVYFPYDSTDAPAEGVMVKALGSAAWPSGKVTIEGPPF